MDGRDQGALCDLHKAASIHPIDVKPSIHVIAREAKMAVRGTLGVDDAMLRMCDQQRTALCWVQDSGGAATLHSSHYTCLTAEGVESEVD